LKSFAVAVFLYLRLRFFVFFFRVAKSAPSDETSIMHKYVKATTEADMLPFLPQNCEQINSNTENIHPEITPARNPFVPLNFAPEYPHKKEHITIQKYEKGRMRRVGSEFL
jgi:hypothetical protein